MADEHMTTDTSPGSGPGRGVQTQAQQAQSQADAAAAALKLTRGTSCVLCQQRKVRCDKNKPCANCVKAKVECRVVPPQPPRRRKKRLQERDLVDRLKKYESLLTEHGVKFESIGQELRAPENNNPEDVEDLENDFEGLRTSPSASASPSREQDEKKAGMWFSIHKEFRASEQLLHDSSEEEAEGPLIHRAYDRMFGNQDGFPFIIGGAPNPVTHLHPNPIHIFQLWQLYIDNINPLLKITHIPTVQPQVLQAASQLDKAPSNIEALMFGIYLMAITSLEDADVQTRFHAPKKVLIGRYTAAVQQALINASFMRVNDSLVLQAFVLYLFAVRWFTDPRQVFCLIGIAVRIAERMGLHRDPGGHGLPPFEVEQRRRLWWTLVGYDRRLGEMTGSTVTALSSGGDCKPPLNVNDSDLHTEGKDMPVPHNGPTEMLFALTRAEIAMAVASNSNRDSHKIVPKDAQAGSPKPGNQPAMIHLAGQDSPPYTLEGFCAHIEGTYLQHCDPKIPLHFFTLTMTRQHLCKMRIIGFLVRMHDAEAMPLKDIERDSLFLQATQMIEYDNVVQSSESLQPFKWYSMHYFPFPAYMFLVQELRTRSTGPMVERAWDAITANHELRGLLNNLHNPMHMAFGNLFVKSWDSHELAQRGLGKHVSAPHFINVLRERSEKRRQARADSQAEPVVEQPVELPRTSGPPSVAATATSDQPVMMTPPQQAQSQHSTENGDDDMDWSYLVAGYNDVANYQNFRNYGSGFGPPPMGPTGANMPGMGPGMGAGMGPGMGRGIGGGMGGVGPMGGMGIGPNSSPGAPPGRGPPGGIMGRNPYGA